MPRSKIYPFNILFHYSSPWNLLAGLLMYCLGSGLVVFLGGILKPRIFWLGLVTILILQITGSLLKVYFDSFETDPRQVPLPRLKLEGPQEVGIELPRGLIMVVAATTLTVGAMLTVLLSRLGAISAPTMIILGLAFTLAFFYGVPPLRLSQHGFGELTQAILITNLIPALAFMFQTGIMHRLVPMLTFPLTSLFLAMIIILSLQGYAEAVRLERKTLLTQIGWQRGIVIHNGLVLITYAIVGLAAILGLPWSLTWPQLLTMPIALFQVYLVWQLSGGEKPRWRLLNFNALAMFALMVYFVTLATWTG